MPFALLLFGFVALVAAIRGKQKDLFELLKDDFTGSGNFILWVMAIVFLVALGNVQKLKPITDAFLVLIILVMILATGKNGLFQKFLDEVKAGTS